MALGLLFQGGLLLLGVGKLSRDRTTDRSKMLMIKASNGSNYLWLILLIFSIDSKYIRGQFKAQ
jgi:hypothetical protein